LFSAQAVCSGGCLPSISPCGLNLSFLSPCNWHLSALAPCNWHFPSFCGSSCGKALQSAPVRDADR
jgi:hypothetical protein